MRLGFITAALATLCGCTQTTTLTVNFTVPFSVQETIAAYPVRVGFRTDLHSGRTWSICGPSDTGEDLIIEVADTATVCVTEPLLVEAAIAPYTPPSTGCVAEFAGSYTGMIEAGLLEETTTTAFTDASSTTCISREESVEILFGT